MKKIINNLTDVQMVMFSHCYAFYCLLLWDVSVWSIGISAVFWFIISFLMFVKKQKESIEGLKFVSLYLALKWIFCKDIASDNLCAYLLINFFICGLYICSFNLKKIIQERKKRETTNG